jgi:hypothetical protein
MSVRPQAIVDLSYIIARKRDDIQSDLSGYRVVISFELIYEIMTNSRGSNPRRYLDKIADLDLVRTYPLIGLVNDEVRTGRMAAEIIDRRGTEALIDFARNGRGIDITDDVGASVRRFFERDEPRRFREGLDRMWAARFDPIFKQIPAGSLAEQFERYQRLAKQPGSNEFGRAIAVEHNMRQTPAAEWLIFQWERLRNFLAFWYRANAARSFHLPDKTLSNDLVDLHYLAFLPRADAIATGDKRLIAPLARAFGLAGLVVISP